MKPQEDTGDTPFGCALFYHFQEGVELMLRHGTKHGDSKHGIDWVSCSSVLPKRY